MAVYRPIAAFITGVLGGACTAALVPDDDASGAEVHPAGCCCAAEQPRSWRAGWKHGFVTLPRDIGKPLLLGLAIAAALAVVVPENFFAETLGTGLGAMLVMMLLGIPLYVCATASVPVAAALILKGVTPGAALVFLVTGPATNAAGVMILWRTLGRRTTLIYLATVALCALAGGLLFDQLAAHLTVTAVSAHHGMHHPWWEHLSGVLLLAIVARALWQDRRSKT